MSEENVEGTTLPEIVPTPAMDLVQLWRDGELEKFDEIVTKQQRLACNLAYFLLRRDYQHSCRIAGEAFACAYHNPYKFHDEQSLKIFLCQTIISIVKAKLKQDETQKDELLRELLEGHKTDKVPTHWAAEDILAEKERLQGYILDNLETLSFDQMTILVLRDIVMLSYEEIAAIMKWPLKSVNSRLHRARIELKDKIRDVIYSGM